jgi:hypothetical protein
MSQGYFRIVCDGHLYSVILSLPGIEFMQFHTVVSSTSLDAGSFTQAPGNSVNESINSGSNSFS